jgi:transposase
MAISLPDSRQLPDVVRNAYRLLALHGHALGYTEAELAELLGVSRETISRWHSAYVEGGLDALPGERSGRPLGSGRSLTDEQAERIQHILDSKMPDEMNIPAPLWNRRVVRDVIQTECGVLLAVRTVGTYLARWG